jgi:hypothetical protein
MIEEDCRLVGSFYLLPGIIAFMADRFGGSAISVFVRFLKEHPPIMPPEVDGSYVTNIRLWQFFIQSFDFECNSDPVSVFGDFLDAFRECSEGRTDQQWWLYESLDFFSDTLDTIASHRGADSLGILVDFLKQCSSFSSMMPSDVTFNPYIVEMQLLSVLVPYASEVFDPVFASMQVLRGIAEGDRDRLRWMCESLDFFPGALDIIASHCNADPLGILMDFLQQCLPFSSIMSPEVTFNPCIVGMQLLSTFVPYASETLDLMSAPVQVLQAIAEIEKERGRLLELFEIAPFIPGFVYNVAGKCANFDDFMNLLTKLLDRNPDAVAFLFNGVEQLPVDPCPLVIKMFARLKEDDLVLSNSFFSVLFDRLRRVSFAGELFNKYVESVMECLGVVFKEEDEYSHLIESLEIAEGLLNDVVVPEEVQLDPGEDLVFSRLNEILADLLGTSVVSEEDISFMSDLFSDGRSSVPVYAYEVLGNLALTLSENKRFPRLMRSFLELSPVMMGEGPPLRVKERFVRSLGCQFLYLHQALMQGMQNVPRITEEEILGTNGDPLALAELLLRRWK